MLVLESSTSNASCTMLAPIAAFLGDTQQPVDTDLVNLGDGKHGIGARQAHILGRQQL